MTARSRNLTEALAAEVDGAHIQPITLVQLEFDGGNVNLWTGMGDANFLGETFIGGGNLLSIEPIEETQDLRAVGARFTLTGIDPAFISTALNEDYRNRPARMWLGALDAAGVILADPFLIFEGRMDVMTPVLGRQFAAITLTAENRLIDLTRPRVRRYTPEDQNTDYPTDKGLEFVAGLQDKQVKWLSD